MTQMNDNVKVGAPSGAAAYNVQGSTLHRLPGISVSRPEEKNTGTALENLQECLKHLLCLIIDERSMMSSKILAAAERNIQHSVYKGQNSGEIWGGEVQYKGTQRKNSKCHKHQQQKCQHHNFFVKEEVFYPQMSCQKLYSHSTKITESKTKSSETSSEGYAQENQQNEMQK
jgi:hypothetical protein